MATTKEIRHFARAAQIYARANQSTLRAVLNGIILRQFSTNVVDGRSVVSVAVGGTQTTFDAAGDFTPEGLICMANESLDWASTFPDPDNPDFTAQRVKRLRVSFARATR